MEGRSQHHQLIDENKGFHRDAIDNISKALSTANRDYHSVAIIGVQNSGKSTLLNHLFGTQFQVLKAQSGTRTTRGIWVSSDQKENILVFDVQGNDSMDRIEQQDFEKMVATYALVTANVLVINTWSKTLGQHHGSQYETLKIILDICITQFKQQSPKTILFCLRDFNDQFENQRQIKKKVVDDVSDIWRKIEKPKQLDMFSDKAEKFFTIQVSCLRKFRPDKPQKFIQDVAKLRQKFVNPKAQGYVFAKQKIQFNLPIADLPELSQNSWNSIKTNKKLNLPNQKQQLASFRCSTILGQIQNQFQKQLSQLTQDNLITDFGKIKQKYMNEYHQKTYHYGKNIAEQKAKELSQTINDVLKKTAQQKIDEKTKELIKQFNQESKNFSIQSQLTLDEQINKIYQVKLDQYIKYVKNLNFQLQDRKQKLEQFSNKLKEDKKELKANILKKNQQQFSNQSSRTTRLLSSSLIKDNFGLQFWEKARSSIQKKSQQLAQKYRKSYIWVTGQELDPVDYSNISQNIRDQSKRNIKQQLSKSFSDKIFNQFKLQFNKDEDGSSINFNLKTQQQIDKHFDKTRDYILDLIQKMNKFNETPRTSYIEDIDQENNLFDLAQLTIIERTIKDQMVAEYQKVKRRKKQGEMNQVPWWMFAIIFFFVYDDLWFAEEDSPIIHYTLLVVVLVLGTLFAIGQGKVIKESVRIVSDKLKQKIPFLR